MAIRVHTLAKELGVKSKAILDKCTAEGLDVKNHMSVLSAGLEATIREWFSEGDHRTTEETTDRVDLEKVKAKPRRRVRKKAAEKEMPGGPAEGEEAQVALAEEGAPPATVEAAEQAPEAVAEMKEPEAAEAGEPVAVEAAGPEATEMAAPTVEETVEARPEASVEEAVEEEVTPQPIKPAGPVHVPTPAVLRGPRVVRVDKAEPIRRPAPGKAAPPKAPPLPELEVPLITTPERRGKKGKAEVPPDEEAVEKAKKGKARVHPRREQTPDGTEQLREWRDRDLLERSQRLAAASDYPQLVRRAEPRKGKAIAKVSKRDRIQIAEPITLKDFCAATGIPFNRLLAKLLEFGMPATINQSITGEQAEMLGLALELEIEVVKQKSRYEQLIEQFANREPTHLAPRAPIVTFLGHVDHGKTSILDRLRHSRVAEGEAGGITQHIGAYRYKVGGAQVVFLDTPGHEAFTALRARGAQMTDIVVLVVAADDGVMPQTVEAISHAKAANVPIVVALNKIDLPNVDINRVFSRLAEHALLPAEWGGDTDVIRTSAVTGEGLDQLIEHLHTLAELLDLKADPTGPAAGVVIEARQDMTRGPAADLMVREGTLKVGDVIVAGRATGRVRAIFDDLGNPLPEAGPATPVEVLGLDEVPEAGERFHCTDDLQLAKSIAEEKRQEEQKTEWTARPRVTLESIFERVGAGEVKELNLIIRADTQGSVDVLRTKLEELGTNEVKVRILHADAGGITEGDVLLAEASQAIIIGFGVVADDRARARAQEAEVEIRTYTVIYHLIEDIAHALEGLLEPTYEQTVKGRAAVKELFRVSRVGTVAGCLVTEGVIERSAKIRVIRQNVIIREDSALESLKRFKDDARDVRQGFECGIKIAGFDDVKEGDVIEAYEVVEVARKLQPTAEGQSTR